MDTHKNKTKPIFLSDKIKEAYNTKPDHTRISRIAQILKENTPTPCTEIKAKEIFYAYNLAIILLIKEHGTCQLRELTFDQIFNLNQ